MFKVVFREFKEFITNLEILKKLGRFKYLPKMILNDRKHHGVTKTRRNFPNGFKLFKYLSGNFSLQIKTIEMFSKALRL